MYKKGLRVKNCDKTGRKSGEFQIAVQLGVLGCAGSPGGVRGNPRGLRGFSGEFSREFL